MTILTLMGRVDRMDPTAIEALCRATKRSGRNRQPDAHPRKTSHQRSEAAQLDISECGSQRGWVYVWRDTDKYNGWNGPGSILAESPNSNLLWISLRGHLVKASREQVRPATAEEHLGAELSQELSQEMIKDIHTGKVNHYHDIEQEGGPDDQRQFEMPIKATSLLTENRNHQSKNLMHDQHL